jgi:septal ring factor EnvC (AmiA/AmiB activator)
MFKKTTLKQLLTRLLALVLIALTLSLGFAPLSTRSEATSSKYSQAQAKLKGIKDQLATIKSDREKLANRQKTLSGELAYLENRSEEQRKVYDEALEQKEFALEALFAASSISIALRFRSALVLSLSSCSCFCFVNSKEFDNLPSCFVAKAFSFLIF